MKRYITIDGGTTNTRASLVADGRVLNTVKIPVGAKKSIGGNTALKEGLHRAIAELLSAESLTAEDIAAVLASGMITSEFGLVNLPHITAPAGINELSDSMAEVLIPEVFSKPICFVRGVKTVGTLEETDMMRGEETELIGIMNAGHGKCVYVLPGSHSKLIYTDSNGRITHFSTTLTGEMMSALSDDTILKDAVTLPCYELDIEKLDSGYEYAVKHGINEALFKTRILKNLFGCDKVECYSFFFGAVLADEINSIIASSAETVVIGGKKQFREATAHLVEKYSELSLGKKKKTVVLNDAEVDASTSNGMIKIYENKRLEADA